MELRELYEKIELPLEMVEQLVQIEKEFSLMEVEQFLQEMVQLETAEKAYNELVVYLKEDQGNMKMLYCQLECARRIYEKYKQLQISDKIYIDTMKCFTRFANECKKRNGAYFFDRGWWTYRQISMKLFRVGVLEYELCQKEKELMISMHIPSDSIFGKVQVDNSLKEAKEFLHQFYPLYDNAIFYCDSWLLSPALESLLSEESNILNFQKRFQITNVYEEANDFLEWLFQSPENVAYEQLPEHTSLQRKAKQWVLAGKKIGVAYGILHIKKDEIINDSI